jgi:hypothetical protein
LENPRNSTRRQLRIEQRLADLIGDGAAVFFRDALKFVSGEIEVESSSNVIWHYAREIESAVLTALNPLAPYDVIADREHQRVAQIDAIVAALELPADDPVIKKWRNTSLHRFAHRKNLGPPRPFSKASWDSWLAAIEVVLDQFEARYERMLGRLKTVAAAGPSAAGREASYLLRRIPPTGRMVGLAAFFETADSRWLDSIPRSILAEPPEPVSVRNQPGYVWEPGWPVSRYLARVATEKPVAVFAKIMPLTKSGPKNTRVHVDLVNAAIEFSPSNMAAWAEAEALWVRKQRFFPFVVPAYTQVVEALAAAGETRAAFTLAEAIVGLHDDGATESLEPGLRMRSYEYLELLPKVGRALVAVDGPAAVSLLADLVVQAIGQTHPGRVPPFDGSSIWLPSIADHPQNEPSMTTAKMVLVLRDVLELAIRAGALSPVSALEALDRYAARSSVFTRLGVHIARVSRGRDRDQAISAARDPTIYVAPCYPEAYLLLTEIGSELDSDDRILVLQAISASSLGDEAKADLGHLVIGEVEPISRLAPESTHPGFLSWHERGEPLPSPITAAELNEWPVERVVSFLAGWQPDAQARWRGSELLEDAFQRGVGAEPTRYSAAGRILVDLPPRFATRYVYALTSALRAGVDLDLSPLIDLFEAGLVNPGPWVDDHYADARKAVAWLLVQALGRRSFQVVGVRDPLWSVLAALSDDPSPTPADEERVDVRADGIASLMLNSTRPQALQAAIFYGARVKEQVEPTSGLPVEVRALLERHLDPRSDTSLAVRYGIGDLLSVLVAIDREWVTAVQPALFGDEDSPFREAVWSGYLAHPQLYGDVFRILEPQYERALLELEPAREATPDEARLADHLMLMAELGAVTPGSPDGLIETFFVKAPAALAKTAVDTAGWRAWRLRDDPPDDEAAERLRHLWRRWADSAAIADHGIFGWWFASSRLGDEWSLGELERIVADDVELDDLHAVLPRLATLVAGAPERIGELVDAIISDEIDADRLLAADDPLADIVTVLTQDSSSSRARKSGDAIIGRMRARGFVDFPSPRLDRH